MPEFDPSIFEDMMDDYIEVADQNLSKEYKRELNSLRGLSPEQIVQFGGTSSQMVEVIQELEKARDANLNQAALLNNLKNLGESTYNFAKKISALVP